MPPLWTTTLLVLAPLSLFAGDYPDPHGDCVEEKQPPIIEYD